MVTRDAFEAAVAALQDSEASLQEARPSRGFASPCGVAQKVLAAENNLAVCKFYTKALQARSTALTVTSIPGPARRL